MGDTTTRQVPIARWVTVTDISGKVRAELRWDVPAPEHIQAAVQHAA